MLPKQSFNYSIQCHMLHKQNINAFDNFGYFAKKKLEKHDCSESFRREVGKL